LQDKFDYLDPWQIDIFREIGNIGAGNAATALSALLGRKVEMSVPEIKVLPLSSVPDIMGAPEDPVVGGMVDMNGDLTGQIMLIMGIHEAQVMASIICNIEPPVGGGSENLLNLTELDISSLGEITNILAGSYLSAIASLSGLSIIPSVPGMCIDMAGAMLSLIAVECGKNSDSALFFETRFLDAKDKLVCNFFLLPDRNSYKKLMDSLGGSC
jgi:chemotaxis protein CheC